MDALLLLLAFMIFAPVVAFVEWVQRKRGDDE